MEGSAMSIKSRIAALEGSASSNVYLHFPEDGHDHAAEWAKARAAGGTVHVVRFKGLNDEAVAAFGAAA
jgi:hypothetical protein